LQATAATTSEYLPAKQFVQPVCPVSGWKVPALHSEHTLEEVEEEKYPDAQERHAERPVAVAKVPTPQSSQKVCPRCDW
jgi:hypothetical protein